MNFDLLIKGGEVVDPGGGQSGRLDVAIKRNRIAAVDRDIPAESASRVIDAGGQYVTPGLIDLHTHVYHHVTFWGIDPDPVAARSGVTTWLDVGSAGAFNWPGFRKFIVKPAEVRIYGLLNISAIGLTAMTGELANLDYCDVDLCCKLIDLHRDLILGVKARIDANTVRSNGIEPLRRARAAAERCDLPLMVHIGIGPPAVAEVLALMRPGDILTHCFTGNSMRIIDDRGQLLDDARRAWESGIIMDIGHGAGSFSFETAEALIGAGYRPDVISSDIHQLSIQGPLFDMPTCLSKFLALGMAFPDLIRAATARPAEVLGLQHELGTLKVGALADVALFTVQQGRFPFYDVFMNMREGAQLIRNTLTIANGRPLPRTPDPAPAPWIELSAGQRALIERGHTPEGFAK
jgi:dihydroorotase